MTINNKVKQRIEDVGHEAVPRVAISFISKSSSGVVYSSIEILKRGT